MLLLCELCIFRVSTDALFAVRRVKAVRLASFSLFLRGVCACMCILVCVAFAFISLSH